MNEIKEDGAEIRVDLEKLRMNDKTTHVERKSSIDNGYDSGIGSSPNTLPSPTSPLIRDNTRNGSGEDQGPSPPATLPLNVKIKSKQRRRKRGASTTITNTFDDVFERTRRVLGAGASARVEVCRERKTGKEYAVKIITKENWYTRSRVLQEVEILYRGQGHPNIIQLEQYFEGDNEFYLVFEMMRGGALIDHISSHKMFTEREAAIVVTRVTSALKHLHGQGIAHRDLKFENILCGDNFTDVKICDFDLGGQKLDLSTPLMDSPVGSAEFMAPEVVELFEGKHTFYDKSCDMWSLGVLIYIMVYGKPPFTGRCGLQCGWENGEECRQCQESLFRNITHSKVQFDENENVSEGVKNLITNLLRKDATKRLTAIEVLDHDWVRSQGTDNELQTAEQLSRSKSSALNLHSFSSQANEHLRRINSDCSFKSEEHSPEVDPLDHALQHLDMGESWYEDDDIFVSPDSYLPNFPEPRSTSPPPEPSPPTPTEISCNDNTPVQTRFVFPDHMNDHMVENMTPRNYDPPVKFYFSSDEGD